MSGGTGLLDSVNDANGNTIQVQSQPVVVGSLHGVYPGDDIIVEQYGRDWRYTVSDVLQVNDENLQLIYPVEDDRYTFVTGERLIEPDGSYNGYVLVVARLSN